AVLPADRLDESFGNSVPASVWDRCYLSMSLAQLGRFKQADPVAAESIRLADRTRIPIAVGQALLGASAVHLIKGDWAKARLLVERRIAAYRAGSIVIGLPEAIASSAWVLAQIGEADEALSRVQEAKALYEPRMQRIAWDGGYHALGRACLL